MFVGEEWPEIHTSVDRNNQAKQGESGHVKFQSGRAVYDLAVSPGAP